MRFLRDCGNSSFPWLSQSFQPSLRAEASLFTTEDLGGKLQLFGVCFWWLFLFSPGELPNLFLKQTNETAQMWVKCQGWEWNLSGCSQLPNYIWPWIMLKSTVFDGERLEWWAWGRRFPNLSYRRARSILYNTVHLRGIPSVLLWKGPMWEIQDEHSMMGTETLLRLVLSYINKLAEGQS